MLKQKFDEASWTTQQTFLGIALTLVPWIAVALALSSLNTSSASTKSVPLTPQVDLANAIVNIIFATLIEAAFLIAPFYFAHRAVRSSYELEHSQNAWQCLGFRSFDVTSAVAWIIGLFLAFYAVNVLYQYILMALHLHLQTNDQLILQRSKQTPLTTYATLLASAFVAPFCEEIFFRSFVFMGLLRSMPLGAALIFSALIFAVAHADVGSFAVLFVIGIALAFLRWRSRSIWPSMILHFLNNGVGALLIVLTMQGVIRS